MYGVKFKKNSKAKSPSYRLFITGQYICSIKEKDLIEDYENFLEDPMDPNGIAIYVLNSIDKRKKEWSLDRYADIRLIRDEAINQVVELFESVNKCEDEEDINNEEG